MSFYYHQTRLANGLKVVTVPMPDRETTAVAVWVRAGSRYEKPKISGVSHFLEHMLFKGTKTRTTRQIKEEIEGVGGMLNAFTSEEVTCYFAKLLKEHFSKALDVLSDMVVNATLDGVEFKKEKPVILEEIKMYRDLPAQHVHDLMGEILWPKQPLGRPIAGTIESVTGINRAAMSDYKKKFYQPQNIVVSVSGPVHHENVLRWCRDYYAQKSGSLVSRFEKSSSRQAKPRTLFVEKDTEQTHFVIGLHGYSRIHPDRYKLGVLNVILGANMSSRLFEEVREKRGLAYEIKSGIGFYEDAGSLTVSAGVEPNKTSKAMQVILRELNKLRKIKVTEGELRRAKDYFMSQLVMALEDTMDHLLWVGERAVYQDELPDHKKIHQKIEAVTAEDVRQVARDIFESSNLNLTLIGPMGKKVQKTIERDFEL
ncbi:MAG: insulinase family protein [Candidatus Omnitrophica bacterium]|nr:insulinase family protein [Candidatus Omnitrophota bacterium]